MAARASGVIMNLWQCMGCRQCAYKKMGEWEWQDTLGVHGCGVLQKD